MLKNFVVMDCGFEHNGRCCLKILFIGLNDLDQVFHTLPGIVLYGEPLVNGMIQTKHTDFAEFFGHVRSNDKFSCGHTGISFTMNSVLRTPPLPCKPTP